MQTKSNFWVGVTIWANIAIIFFVYALVYLGVSFAIASYRSASAFVNPLVVFVLTLFAVWTGVKSVLKKTPIDAQNVLSVSLYTILITAITEVVIVTASLIMGRGDWWSVGTYAVQDAFVATLVYYFLSKTSQTKYVAVVVGIVFLGTSIAQGYAVYKQTTAATITITSLQQAESQISNGGTKVETQTIYTNAAINFKMTIPAGWYIATDTSAAIDTIDFYSCPWLTCDALLAISNGGSFGRFSDVVNSELSKAQSDVKTGLILSYQELNDLVPGATVIKETYDTQTSLWPYSYVIIWPYQYPMADGSYETSTFGLFIWASNDKTAESLFSSLAIYGTPE